MFKKKLYRANLNENGEKILFPFLFIAFKSENAIKEAAKKVRWDQYIPGLSEQLDIHGRRIGKIKTIIHEDNVNPILQMLCLRKITWTDWITFIGKPVKNKETLCDYEFSVFWKKLSPLENCMTIPNPLVMSFDIEVNSSVKGSMPNARLEDDRVFQIGCIFARQGSNEIIENHLITLNGINKKYLSSPGISSVNVQCCDSEAELLKKFAELISAKNPNIIIGYNIFEFDIDYMVKRSILNNCYDDLVKQTFHKYKYARKEEIAWSSSAYKNQKFLFINAEGRIYIDLLPLIKRDYKFANYRLKTVSSFFLGETKDPLTPKGIFKCYKIGLNCNGKTAKIRNRARRAMSIVGKYCMIDTILPLKIFEKIKGWIGLVELSKVCNTAIFDLFTRGQQLKIFSQVYKICLNDNYVVEKNGYVAAANESYTGAHVFLPRAGVYDNVLPLDFSSLYPNIMIAYNICYSTWVPEDSDIPEEKCHVIQWHDHFNCEHDTVKRAGSKKSKKVICAARRYKFLKEPLGVVPTMLQNLLNARDAVKALMKKEKDETMGIVLNCKQLALKVSANSTYGSYGVRKGKLPFMPGAMCVTAIGREAIQKVAKIAVDDHEAELVYGDSVTGDTPITLRNSKGKIVVKKISKLGENWKWYPQFKTGDPSLKNKEQGKCEKYQIFTSNGWKKIVRVIKHSAKKKIYSVRTRRGFVKITEDHSLLDAYKNKVKPENVKIGDELYHSSPCDNYKRYQVKLRVDNETFEMFDRFYRFGFMTFTTATKMQRMYHYIKNNSDNDIEIVIDEKIGHYCIQKIRSNSTSLKSILEIIDITNYDDNGVPMLETVYDIETEDGTFAAGIGEIIVSNTDSTYLRFPKIDKPEELWDNANRVAKIISDHFPPAMNIIFEQVIYARFMILTKKRYMSLACGKDGKIFCDKSGTPQIQKKGVLLSRRDNSKFVRDIYSKIVISVFEKIEKEKIISLLIELVLYIYREKGSVLLDIKDFVITKSVGEISEYKIRPLSDDPKKRKKRLKEMGIDDTLEPHELEEEYRIRSLPAQAQLFVKMKSSRGENIGAGTRLEYVLIDVDNIKAKGFEKIEDIAYFTRYKHILKIDKLYYIKALIQPLDELLEIIGEKQFMKKFYKTIERKRLCLDNLKKYIRPKIIVEEISDSE
jgi:DNA polymerase elongation subunit (family B)